MVRHTSTRETESIMDSVDPFQVGVLLEYSRIGPLSLRECMYRRHGGHMFGDMVDGFRSSYLL